MKFIINRTDLLKTLLKTQGIIEKKILKPVLETILIEVNAGRMDYTATDLQVGIHGSCMVEVLEEGKITLPGKKVLEIVRELSGEKVSFWLNESSEGGSSIVMSCGNAVFNINNMDPEKYPALPLYEDVDLYPIGSKKIREMIRETVFAASIDDKMRNINGVFFEKDGKTIRMVCTDGHRLSIVEEENEESENLKLEKGVVFPKKGLNELKRILEEEKEEERILFGFRGNNGIFKTGNLSMVMRLVDSEYPDYTVFIPKDTDKSLRVNRKKFLSSLKRVSLLSGEGSKVVRFSISGGSAKNHSIGKMEMRASSSDYGEAYDEIELDYHGDDLTVTFNAAYFIEALGILGGEDVLIELKDSESGAVLKRSDGKNHKCVIMPIRT